MANGRLTNLNYLQVAEFLGIKCVVTAPSFISISGNRTSDRSNLKDGTPFLLRRGLSTLLGTRNLMQWSTKPFYSGLVTTTFGTVVYRLTRTT